MIRRGGVEDLGRVFAIQRESSVAGFANVFPPERFPYPDATVRDELHAQLSDPQNVVLLDGDGRGFALVGHDRLQRLFVVPSAWGTGVADELHAAAVDTFRELGTERASLWCLAENARARRFYERRGWRLNGEERVVEFPPFPLDVGYSLDLDLARPPRPS